MKKIIKYMDMISRVLNRVLVGIAGTVLVFMMALACANVVLRNFGFPIKGTFELMGFLGAIMAAFALGITQIKRGHITVDVLTNLFPDRLKIILNGISYVVAMAFFVLVAWQTARWGTILWEVNELSETLRIIYFPFVYGVSIGCMMIAFVLLIDILKLINGENGVKS